jgi:hypothetical protein
MEKKTFKALPVTREQCQDQHNDVEWIKHPEWWSWGGICPLKKPGRVFEAGGQGFIEASKPLRVVLGNIFSNNENAEVKDYTDAEAIVADGWRVD